MKRNTSKLKNEHGEHAWRHNARTSQLISMGKGDKLNRKCMNDTEAASETWREQEAKKTRVATRINTSNNCQYQYTGKIDEY